MSKKGRIKWSGSLFLTFVLIASLFAGVDPERVWAKEETSAVTQDSSEEDTLQAAADAVAEDKAVDEKDTEKDQGTDKKNLQILGQKNELVTDGVVGADAELLPALSDEEVQSFQRLNVQLSRYGDNALRVRWNQVPGADGYELYGSRCNTSTSRYEMVKFTTLSSPTMIAWMCENLKENTYYKLVVRAYRTENGTKSYLARSQVAHMPTGGGTYDTIEDVTVKKEKVSLAVGKTATLTAALETSGKNISFHQRLRYESDKPAVATVDSKGRVRAKKKGTCTIYVYAQNGKYTTVKVTVR